MMLLSTWNLHFVCILVYYQIFVTSSSLRGEITAGVFCRDPKDIENGRRLPQVTEIGLMAQGSQLHFSCLPGYLLEGSSKMVCGNKGNWEPPNKPTCKPVVCPELHVENGQIQPRKESGKYYPGLMVQVTCNDGYRLKDKYMDLIECHMTGSWMRHTQASDEFLLGSDLPICVEQTCTSPPQLMNSDVQIQGDVGWDGGYVLGSVVTYLCRYGFQIEDLRGSRLVCRKNGQWEPEHDDTALSKCVQGGCSRPLPIVNGNFAPHLTTVYPYFAIVTYYCYMGFSLSGHTYTFQCMADGKWSPFMQPEYLPMCQHHSASGCPDPPYINHGHIIKINSSGPSYGSDLYPENTVVHYECQSGYRFYDCTANKIICKEGRWIQRLPQCVELNGCGQPPAVPYAIISHHDSPSTSSEDSLPSVPLYSKIHYKCLPGFTLLGTPDLTCGLDGCWAPNLPQCVLLGPPYEPPEWNLLTTPSSIVQQNDISWTDTHLMTVSIATAGSIIGALLLIQLLVVFQRRKCCFFLFHRQRRHRQHPHYHPRRSSSTSASLASSPCRLTTHDQDRVALIAFADGVQVVLPTYEEAIRQSGPPALEALNSIRGPSNRGFLPMLPRRSRTRNSNNNADSSVTGPTRHSSTSTSHSASGVDSMGSTDTMATSEVSTAVTLDTLSSTASNASQQLSCRAMCGSLTSFDTSSVINSEGVPLLEEAEIETSETNDHIASDDEIVSSPTSG